MKARARQGGFSVEVIVGAFMVFVLLGLGYFTIILSRENLFTRKYPLEVVFDHVMGLRDGDNVVVRGVPLGKIKSLEMKNDGVHVVASMDMPVVVREGYRVEIRPTSALGGRQMEVEEGPKNAPELPRGVPLIGETPFDLISEGADLFRKVEAVFAEGGLIDNLQIVSEKLRAVSIRVEAGEGLVGRLFSSDDTLYEDLSGAVASLRTVSERLESGKGTLGKLLSEDDQLYDDLAQTVSSLQRVAAKLENGEGMLGKLISDDQLATDVEEVIQEVRASVDDFRETTPVATFTSIFFGAF